MNPKQKEGNPRPYSKYPKRPYTRQTIDDKVRIAVAQEMKKKEKKSESKMYDRLIAASPVDFSGIIIDLFTGIVQGVSDSNYIGSDIRPTTLRIKMSLQATDSIQMFRVVVLQTIGGGVPTPATVLQSVGNIRAPLSPFERDYLKTYKVLFDELYTQVLNTESAFLSVDIRIPYNKLRNVEFTDTVGTIEANGIYLLLISDSAAVSHPVA